MTNYKIKVRLDKLDEVLDILYGFGYIFKNCADVGVLKSMIHQECQDTGYVWVYMHREEGRKLLGMMRIEVLCGYKDIECSELYKEVMWESVIR